MASLSKQRDAHLTLPVLRPDGPEIEDKDEEMPEDLAELFLQSQSTLVTHLDVISTGGTSSTDGSKPTATTQQQQQQNMECRILELSDPVLLNHVLILPLGARLGTVEGKTDNLTSLEIWANDYMPILQLNTNEDVHTNFLRAARNRRLTYNRGAIPGSTVYTPPTARWKSTGSSFEEFPDFLLTTRLTIRGCYKTLTVCILGHLKVDAKKLITKTIEYVASRLPSAKPSLNPNTDIYFARNHPAEDAQGRYRPRTPPPSKSVVTDLRCKLTAPPALSTTRAGWTTLRLTTPSGPLRPELSREVLLLMQAIQQSGRCPIEPMIWRFWDIIIELVNAAPLSEPQQSRRAHFETTLSRWMSDPELDTVAEAMVTLIQLIFIPPLNNNSIGDPAASGGVRPEERLTMQSQERLSRVVAIYFTQSARIHKLPDGGQSLVIAAASVLTDLSEFRPRTLRTALLELIFVLVSANPRLLNSNVIEILDGGSNSDHQALTGVDSQDVMDGLDCLKALYYAKEALLARNYDALIHWVIALSAGFGVGKDQPLEGDTAPAEEAPPERSGRRVVMQMPAGRRGPPGNQPWKKKSGTDPFLFVSHRLILGKYPDDYRARDVLKLPPFFVELFAQTEFLNVKGSPADVLVPSDAEQLQRVVNYLVLNVDGGTLGLADDLLARLAAAPPPRASADVSPLFLLLHLRHESFTIPEIEVLSSKPNGLLALALYLVECSLIPNRSSSPKLSYMILLNIIEGLSFVEIRRLIFAAILHAPDLWDEWFPFSQSQQPQPLRVMPEDLDLRPEQFLSKMVKATALLDGPEFAAEILEAIIEYTGADSSYSTECDAAIRKAAGLINSLEVGDIANAKTRILGGFERGGRVVVPNVFCKIDDRISPRAQAATLKFLNTIISLNLSETTRASNYQKPGIGGSLFIGPLLHLEKFTLSQFFPPIRYLSPDQTTRLLGILRRTLAFAVAQSASPKACATALSLLKKFSQYGVWEKHREMDGDIWNGVKCLMMEATKTWNVELLEGCLQFLRSCIVQTHSTIRWWLFNRIVLELRGTVELDKLCFTALRAVYDDDMLLQLHPATSKVDWTLTISPHQPPIMPNHVTPTMLETQAGVLLCLSCPSASTRLLIAPDGALQAPLPKPDEAMLLRIAGETLEFDPTHRNIPLEHRVYICAMLPSHHYKDINALRISMLSDKARVYSTSVFGGTVDIYDRDSLTWTVIKQLIGKQLSDHVTAEFWQSANTSELSIEGITSMLDRVILILSDSNDEGLVAVCHDLLTVLVQSKLPVTQLLTERVKMLVKFYNDDKTEGAREFLHTQVYPRIERLFRSIMTALIHNQKGTDLSSLIHICSEVVDKMNRRLTVLTLTILCQLYPLVIHQTALTFSLLTSMKKATKAVLVSLITNDGGASGSVDEDLLSHPQRGGSGTGGGDGGGCSADESVESVALKNDLELALQCLQMQLANRPLQILLTSNLTEAILDFVSPHIVSDDLEALGSRGLEPLEISTLTPIGSTCALYWSDPNIKNTVLKILTRAPPDIAYMLFSIPKNEPRPQLTNAYFQDTKLNNPIPPTQRVLKDIIPQSPPQPLNLPRCLDIVRESSIQLKEYKVQFGVFESFFPDPTKWLLPPRYVAVAKSSEEQRDDKSVDIMARPIFHKTIMTAPLVIPMESLEDPDVQETAEDGNTRQKRSISAKAAKMANNSSQQQQQVAAAEDWTTYQYIASTMQQANSSNAGGPYGYEAQPAPMDSWDQLIESAPQNASWGGNVAAAGPSTTGGDPLLYTPTILSPPAPVAPPTLNLPPLNVDELMEDPMCRELANRDGFRDLIIDCAQNGINFVGLLRDPTSVRQNPALYSQFLSLAQNHELTHGLLRMSGIL